MSLVDDLRVARALIDTPEKLTDIGIVGALEKACGEKSTRLRRGLHALRDAKYPVHIRDLECIQATFDRAIAAAEAKPCPTH